mmetsp:Transcript_52088/g.158176  ORF Transcript_52088/g.158176 Transcript_52088/m.158176 type:complete len:362 (-) Transcript_52088:1059-2144(-)
MRAIAGAEGLSNKELIVEISSKGVPDLELVDLPGLILNPFDGAVEMAANIKQLQASYVRKENVEIVAVVKSTESVNTLPDWGALKDVAENPIITITPPRVDWRAHCLVVANYVNLYLDAPTMTNQKANEFFHGWHRMYGEMVVLVHLSPPPRGDELMDDAEVAERAAYLGEIETLEAKWMADLKAKLEVKCEGKWNADNDKMFGIPAALKVLQRRWQERFLNSVPAFKAHLQREVQDLAGQVGQLEASLADRSPQSTRDKIRRFVLDFVLQYQAFVGGNSVRDDFGKDVTNFKMQHWHRFEPQVHGLKFAEELHMFPFDSTCGETCAWLGGWQHASDASDHDISTWNAPLRAWRPTTGRCK